jgi:hypothetical protein
VLQPAVHLVLRCGNEGRRDERDMGGDAGVVGWVWGAWREIDGQHSCQPTAMVKPVLTSPGKDLQLAGPATHLEVGSPHALAAAAGAGGVSSLRGSKVSCSSQLHQLLQGPWRQQPHS